MLRPMSETNGFTTKEIVEKVWRSVEQLRADTTTGFKDVNDRLRILENSQAEGSTGRKIGGYIIQAVTTLLIGALMALILAPKL
jgi:hypothetical protein